MTTKILGHLDSCNQMKINGWGLNEDNLDQPIEVEIIIDNNLITSVNANLFRPDLLDAKIGNGSCGFSVLIPDQFHDNVEHSVIVREASTKLVLIGSPKTFQILSKISSHIDVCNENVVSGWAVNENNLQKPVNIEIFINGNLIAQQIAIRPTPKLIIKDKNQLQAGFRIPIPQTALPTLIFEIEARAHNQVLSGFPIKIDLSNQVSINIIGIENYILKAKLSGWSGQALKAKLFIDGNPIGELIFTPTHASSDQKNYLAEYVLTDKFIDARPHVYYIQLHSGSTIVRSDIVILSYPEYKINIDKYDYGYIEGWGLNLSTKSSINFEAKLNNQHCLPISNHLSRLDVINIHDTPTNCGFKINIPPQSNEFALTIDLIDADRNIVICRINLVSYHDVLQNFAYSLAKSSNVVDHVKLYTILPQLINQNADNLKLTTQFYPPLPRVSYPSDVDIIIPVYKGTIETIECIESVLAATNITPTRILIINDSSPDSHIKNYLDSLEHRNIANLHIYHRLHNAGFVDTVNIGMLIADDHDVILLNSDTVVHSNWLDRLATIARSDPHIGTVTPTSNNAEICTIPYICKVLPIDDLALASEIDTIAATVNAGKFIDIPVAIGFCMYIRRSCLDAIGGLFDTATWGQGYGEEVDFCLKASAQGWRHVMAGDAFVVHRGNVSFGDEKLQLIQHSSKKISELYPFYDQLIQRFIARDPIANVRRNINLELINRSLPPKRILHISHNLGGGTDQYLQDTQIFNLEAGYTPLTLYFNSTGESELNIDIEYTRLSGFFTNQHREHYTKDDIDILQKNLVQLNIERLHLHSPIGMPLSFLEWLVDTFSTFITIHDYAWICPRIYLVNAGSIYCKEPSAEQCNHCVKIYPPFSGLRNLLNSQAGDVAKYRDVLANVLAKAEQVFTGTNDVVQRMQRHGLQANYQVIPHQLPKDSVFNQHIKIGQPPVHGSKIKVALIGGISDIKGFYQLIDCAKDVELRRLPIEFIVFGNTMDNSQLQGLSSVRVLGAYKETELTKLMLTYRPHLSFFPNQAPETFSYTLSHAFRFELWPLVTDIGAPAERVRVAQFGETYPLDMQARAINDRLLQAAWRVNNN